MAFTVSNRVQLITDIAWQGATRNQYQHIWDMCCDHGHIGISLLTKNLGCQIHFVDQVATIMQQLQGQLERFFARQQNWHVHTQDAASIRFTPKEKHLVIIAGVGGHNTSMLINQMLQHAHVDDIDFLVCPVHQLWGVRHTLIEHHYQLITEQILQENRRFYEVIHVSQAGMQSIATTGSLLWQHNPDLSQQYLQRLIDHYQRISSSGCDKSSNILKAYQEVELIIP